jgi:hypothetical protein
MGQLTTDKIAHHNSRPRFSLAVLAVDVPALVSSIEPDGLALIVPMHEAQMLAVDRAVTEGCVGRYGCGFATTALTRAGWIGRQWFRKFRACPAEISTTGMTANKAPRLAFQIATLRAILVRDGSRLSTSTFTEAHDSYSSIDPGVGWPHHHKRL